MNAVHIDGAWLDPETHQPIQHDARGVARVIPLRAPAAAIDRATRSPAMATMTPANERY